MFWSKKLNVILVLVAGALLGYFAALSNLRLDQPVSASPSDAAIRRIHPSISLSTPAGRSHYLYERRPRGILFGPSR